METEGTLPLKTGIEFVSEVLLPGGSNLVKGDFLTGGIHTVLGFAAKAVLGVPGLLLVSANSFARATTGHNLLDNLEIGHAKPPAKTEVAAAPAPAATTH